METNSFRLRKYERLKLRRSFDLIYQKGNTVQNDWFILLYIRNGLDYSRIGIVIKRAFGKANRRNKLRRWYRECYRLNKKDIPQGYDYLLIVRSKLGSRYESLNYNDLCTRLLELFGRVLRDEKNVDCNS